MKEEEEAGPSGAALDGDGPAPMETQMSGLDERSACAHVLALSYWFNLMFAPMSCLHAMPACPALAHTRPALAHTCPALAHTCDVALDWMIWRNKSKPLESWSWKLKGVSAMHADVVGHRRLAVACSTACMFVCVLLGTFFTCFPAACWCCCYLLPPPCSHHTVPTR